MYLVDRDFELYCDSQTLTQVVNVDSALRRMCEFAAEDQVKTYLSHRYDLSNTYGEFTNTSAYVHTTVYKGNNRIYLDGNAYVNATAYVVNNIVSYNGSVYVCILNSTGNLPTNATYWTLLGERYAFYYITLPSDAWDFQKNYLVGDTIWYKDKEYTCAIPHINITPDSQYGANYWGTGTAYTVNAGTIPTNTTYWTSGDNRNNYLVQMLVEICVYNMFKKVAPRNIQQFRIDNYNMALDWLKMAASGEVTADLPLKTPEQGSRIRWGSIDKADNLY